MNMASNWRWLCLLSQCRASKQSWNVKAIAGMPRRRERTQYQQVSVLKGDRMVGLMEAGLSYRDIAACTGHAAMTVMHVWNQWREEGRTQRRAGTGPHKVTTAWDDRHLVCMAMTDHTASSTLLSRRWNTALGLDLSASTVCRHLLKAVLGRFYSPRYCPSFRQFHIPYFSRTMPSHMWQGLCMLSSKDNGYHCFPGLHVHQICRPSNMSGIWLVGDLCVMIL